MHITELPDPTPWLSGGELMLTTGIQLRDAPRAARVRAPAGRARPGRAWASAPASTIRRLPEALVDEARRRDFPLFEVPYEMPFIAITEKAFGHLVNEQYEMLRSAACPCTGAWSAWCWRSAAWTRWLAAAAEAIGGAVLVLDRRGETMAAQGVGARCRLPPWPPCGPRSPAEAPEAPPSVGFAPEHPELGGRALALPVARGASARRRRPGWSRCADSGELGDFERLMVQQAVTVVALELMRERVRRDTERRLAGDVLAETLTGAPEPGRGGGAPAPLRHRRPGGGARVRAGGLRRPPSRCWTACWPQPARGPWSPCAARCCARWSTPAGPTRGAGGRCPLALAEAHGEVRAAASRPAPAASLRRSFHEARCALEASALANGAAPEVASYSDLGAFQLLLSVQDDEALRLYCDSVLGPLEDGEGGYGDELVRSLEAFIEHNGQWERRPGELLCHRHTLRYRIKRVEELTGRDLSSARDRIELWLALQGRELVR